MTLFILILLLFECTYSTNKENDNLSLIDPFIVTDSDHTLYNITHQKRQTKLVQIKLRDTTTTIKSIQTRDVKSFYCNTQTTELQCTSMHAVYS